MKKVLLLVLIFLSLCGIAFANDTYFFVSGGNLIPTKEEDNTVEMKSEVISIVCEKDFYQVTVDFDFYNPGKKDVTLSVGFPFFEVGIGGHGKIYGFKCWTNGVETDYSDLPLIRHFSKSRADAKLEKAYVREITFPAKAKTQTRITYKSEYGRDVDGYICKYLYGTGSSWKNSIGGITLQIENKMTDFYPVQVFMKSAQVDDLFERIADNKWEAHFYDVEPEYLDCFSINMGDILDDTGPRAFSYDRYKFTQVKATEKFLFWYTKDQLRICRNTIFALHGYKFKSKDLDLYFKNRGKYWYPKYEINPDFSEDEFSEIEKYNIKLISTEESKRK